MPEAEQGMNVARIGVRQVELYHNTDGNVYCLLDGPDEDAIRQADYVVDLGPGAGIHGGQVVAQGTPQDVAGNPDSLTGAYLSGRRRIPCPTVRRTPQPGRVLRVLDASGFVVITCPDLKSICQLVVDDRLDEPAYQSPAGPITPLDVLYGHRASMSHGNLYMAHRCGFTETVLRKVLAASGFAQIATRARPQHFDLWALACKDRRPEDDVRALAVQHFPA